MNYKILYAEDIKVGDILTDREGRNHLCVKDANEYVPCEDCSISLAGKCPMQDIKCNQECFHFELQSK